MFSSTHVGRAEPTTAQLTAAIELVKNVVHINIARAPVEEGKYDILMGLALDVCTKSFGETPELLTALLEQARTIAWPEDFRDEAVAQIRACVFHAKLHWRIVRYRDTRMSHHELAILEKIVGILPLMIAIKAKKRSTLSKP